MFEYKSKSKGKTRYLKETLAPFIIHSQFMHDFFIALTTVELVRFLYSINYSWVGSNLTSLGQNNTVNIIVNVLLLEINYFWGSAANFIILKFL